MSANGVAGTGGSPADVIVAFLPMRVHEVRKLSLSIRSRAVAQLVRGELVEIVFALPVNRYALPLSHRTKLESGSAAADFGDSAGSVEGEPLPSRTGTVCRCGSSPTDFAAFRRL
jgi:hypothetical protein